MNEVLVTGGAGFIGSHLTNALLDEHEVTVYDCLTTGKRKNVPNEATLIEADVRDIETLEEYVTQADIVFHLAGLVSVEQSINTPPESHATNATGTINVLEAARKHEARVVFASSAAIYGHPEKTPIDEDHPFDPTSPYGLDKLTADYYTRLYHDLYDLDTVALRYFNVYGPGQTGGDYAGVISIFRDQALAGEDITVEGDGTQTRDFVHVDDVIEANLLAAKSDEAVGEAINIGTGTSITIRELAETVQSITDTDSDIVHIDPREGDIDESYADISKAKDLLDFEPTYSLPEGLETIL